MNFVADLPEWAIWTNIIITLLSHAFFFKAACSKPGYLKNENVDFGKLLNDIDAS